MEYSESSLDTQSEGDEVVQEFDVFVSQSLAKSLYIVQHPQRSRKRPPPTPMGVKFKPKNQILEFDYALNQESPHYDQASRGPARVPKLTFTSTTTRHNVQYAVGVIVDGALHLTPVRNVFQMRTKFDHLDTGEMATGTAAEEGDGAGAGAGAGAGGEGAAGPTVVQRTFKKRESAKVAAQRLNQWAALQARRDAEPWKEMVPHDPQSTLSARQRRSLVCQPAQRRVQVPHDQSASEFASSIEVPRILDDGHEDPTPPSERKLSTEALRSLSTAQQVETLMRKARVLSVDQLYRLAPGCRSRQEALTLVEPMAVLVQGCWVIRSPDDGFEGEARSVRDCVLYAFRDHRKLNRGAIQKTLGRNTRLSKLIERALKDVAVLIPHERMWEFCRPQDSLLATAFPDVAERQELGWRRIFSDARANLQGKGLVVPDSLAGYAQPPARRTAGYRVNTPVAAEEVARLTLEQLAPKPSTHIPSRHGGVDVSGLEAMEKAVERGPGGVAGGAGAVGGAGAAEADGTAPVAVQGPGMLVEEEEAEAEVSAAVGDSGRPAAALLAALSRVSGETDADEEGEEEGAAESSSAAGAGSAAAAAAPAEPAEHVPPSKSPSPLNEHLIDAVRAAFSESATVHSVTSCAAAVRGTIAGATDADVEAVLDAIGIPMGVGRRVYALRTQNDNLDQYRQVVYPLFRRKDSLQRSEVMRAVQEAGLRALGTKHFKTLMSTVAFTKGPLWRLREAKDPGDTSE